VPFLVETMSPEGTCIQISLIFTLAVNTFEHVGAVITLLGLQTWRVNLVVYLAAPSKLTIMF